MFSHKRDQAEVAFNNYCESALNDLDEAQVKAADEAYQRRVEIDAREAGWVPARASHVCPKTGCLYHDSDPFDGGGHGDPDPGWTR